jgi:hypothetical protein
MSVSRVIADHGVHSIHPLYEDKWRDMKSLCMGVDNRDATKELMYAIRAFARVVETAGLRCASIVATGLCIAVDEGSMETYLLTQRPALELDLSWEHIWRTWSLWM